MVIINIDQGCLKGKTGVDYNGRKYFSFLGIPYAKPPVGELRFKVRMCYINYFRKFRFLEIRLDNRLNYLFVEYLTT